MLELWKDSDATVLHTVLNVSADQRILHICICRKRRSFDSCGCKITLPEAAWFTIVGNLDRESLVDIVYERGETRLL
jgi:hypothetical protein